MATNSKENYIKNVLSHVDNLFVRRRLERELSDHYDDSLFFEDQSNPQEAGKRVEENMGDPETIGFEVNNQHKSILKTIRKNLQPIMIGILTLLLIGMSSTIYLLVNRVVAVEKEVRSLNNDVTSLSFTDKVRATSINDVNQNIIDIKASIDQLNLYVIPKYYMTGILCCDNEIFHYDSATDTTIITPTKTPLRITVKGKIPSYIKLDDSTRGFSITFDKDNQVQYLFGYGIYSKAAVNELRGMNYGVYDLKDGFVVVKTMDMSWILEGAYDQLANEFLSRKWTVTLVK